MTLQGSGGRNGSRGFGLFGWQDMQGEIRPCRQKHPRRWEEP